MAPAWLNIKVLGRSPAGPQGYSLHGPSSPEETCEHPLTHQNPTTGPSGPKLLEISRVSGKKVRGDETGG